MTVLTDPIAIAALQTFASVLEPQSAIYVCGPLDHGRLWYEAKARGDSGDSVRAINQARLTALAKRLRAQGATPVIDPGLLRVDAWTGREYGDFFLKVIRSFAREAWFIDGWEYSHGATKEYLLCRELSRPTFDEAGQALEPAEAETLLRDAAGRAAELQVDAEKLRSRIDALRALSNV
ncbi:MAG: hypothetical protein ACLP01_25310 [Solirubrobacteraceae bacterium]